jgi:hypothetical protein
MAILIFHSQQIPSPLTVPLPEPSFNSILPDPVLDMFTRPVGFPKDATEQQLLAPPAWSAVRSLAANRAMRS